MCSPSVSDPAPADEASALNNIEAFLEEALSDLRLDALENRRAGPGRPRVLPALCLWAGLLVCVLRGFESQLQLWRLLVRQGLWRFGRLAISDQALYNRLARAGTAPLEGLFAQVIGVLAERLAPYAQTTLAPFAPAVVALDATTLAKLARLLPALRGLLADAKALLAGQVAALFDVRLQQWRTLTFIPDAAENCKVAARGLLVGLAPGTLVLADLGYFGFAWFDDLSDAGFRWVSRLRAKTSYQVIHTFYQGNDTFDGIVWLGAHAADRAAHAVRLVQFRAKGGLQQYVTNVLNPATLPPREVACLYARRWDIELAFRSICVSICSGPVNQSWFSSRSGPSSPLLRSSRPSAWKSPPALGWTPSRSPWPSWSRSSPTSSPPNPTPSPPLSPVAAKSAISAPPPVPASWLPICPVPSVRCRPISP